MVIYMHKASVEKYLKGQIIAFKRMVEVLDKVKEYEPLKKFDGKVINKRINDCFRELLLEIRKNNIINHLSFRYYTHGQGTYNLDFSILKPEGESYPYCITYECTVYKIVVVDSKRFSYDNFISAIDIKLEDLKNDIQVLEDELGNLNDIVTEYEEIQASIKKFNSTYSYYIRQDFKFN